MVEYTLSLDTIFGSLADPTRRDILQRVSGQELSVGEIASPYDLTLAAVSKHLKVLEKAKLIIKHRKGKAQMVRLAPVAFQDAADYLKFYERLLNRRLDALQEFVETN